MEARMLQVFLRVLYTVNSNPQYILAKSSSQVPGVPCSQVTGESSKNEPIYARVPLKACLAVVCDSSPELLQDPTRDFSLYVLDPLEAQPLPTGLAPVSQDANSPRGVAVALGLMSWALESNDSMNVFVTGTVILHDPPSLEVVFALRETKRMPKPIFHSYASMISAPGSSQLPNPPHPPQVAGSDWLSTFRGQQTLTRSADFPELYIGPPRRARGRPEGSTSSKAKGTLPSNTSSLPGVSLSKVAETQPGSKPGGERKSKQKTKFRPSRSLPTFSPFICAPLTRDTVMAASESSATGMPAFFGQPHLFGQNQTQSHAQFHPQAQPYFLSTHNPLLRSLSQFPSTSNGNVAPSATPEQQAALLSVLQGLLATNPHLLQLAGTNMGLSANSGESATNSNSAMRKESNVDDEHERDDGNSDIVVLDSSTIDTAAFRKQSTWRPAASDHDASPLATNQESPMPSSQGTDSSPLPASTPSVAPESTPTVTSDAGTPASKGDTERGNVTASDVPATPTPSRTRKRKLGEYIQGQAHPPIIFPPSPSPSMTRSTERALVSRRVQSSPTCGTKPIILPSARLPSMLDSMRSTRPHVNSLGSPTHEHQVSSTNRARNQPIATISAPSRPKAEHPEILGASLNVVAPDATSLKRRRTLSEFMAEHEARQSAKVRKRSSAGRKPEADVPAGVSRVARPRSTKSVSVSRNAQSSPPRPLFRSDPAVSSLPILVSGTTVSNPPSSSMSSLAYTVPSTSTAVSTKNPLKNFVLPAWARTSTAMLPRLSEETLARQQAEREAKKAQASLRRREAAKAKRKQLHGTDRPSKESSDEDDQAVASDRKLRTLHPPLTAARSAPLPPPPLPALPVFASDVVEPIPPSPPRSHHQRALPVVPSTPPRKPASLGSAPYRTPSKSGSCSLFTPSGQDMGPLFTPSTPNITHSLTQGASTPRSPTVRHRSGAKRSPWKGACAPQTPWTPKRSGSKHPTPGSSRGGRNAQFVSPPGLAVRTPQTQTGMGTRTFLLPPPSPCALRAPHPLQKQAHVKIMVCSAPIVGEDPGTIKEESQSPSKEQDVALDKIFKEEDMLGCETDGALLRKDAPRSPAPQNLSHLPPVCPVGRGASGLCDTSANANASDDASLAEAGAEEEDEERYASSPLPPSSPPPTSAFSSPAKHPDGFDTLGTMDACELTVADSDVLMPSTCDSDGPHGGAAGATTPPWPWLTDSETGAWLTETEAWLTDTEGNGTGGPLLTDSDAAWLSDSDGMDIFADMSSSLLPSSTASNWFSEDADADTDGEFGGMEGRSKVGGFDAAAFERVFAAFVERSARGAEGGLDKDEAGAAHGPGVADAESEFWTWTTMQPVLGGGATARQAVDGDEEKDKVVQDIQALFGGGGT